MQPLMSLWKRFLGTKSSRARQARRRSFEQLELRQMLAAQVDAGLALFHEQAAPLVAQGLLEPAGPGLYHVLRDPTLAASGPLFNLFAADTTNANELWTNGGLGLNLDGFGVTVGVWDGGQIRSSHQELNGRVFNGDSSNLSDHATHVAGTIGATGVTAAARGMASRVTLRNRDYVNDISEMGADAAFLDLSNHSYGYLRGWTNRINFGAGAVDTWVADRAQFAVEDPYFGKYSASNGPIDSNLGLNLAHPQQLDQLLHNNPQLLSVWAAGNDRTDTFTGLSGNSYMAWRSTGPSGAGWYLHSTAVDAAPSGDGGVSGFDTLPQSQVAKNSLTIGSIGDIAADPRTNASVFVSNFSGWGPTDDGRIKPDLVANGEELFSPIHLSDSAYASFSGTSMAAPNATGSGALLIQHYKNRFGRKPLAATTKALLIHSALDAGNVGPDYKSGWGVVDAKAAAGVLSNSNSLTSKNVIVERNYNGSTYTFDVDHDGNGPLRATIVWADPAGVAHSTALDVSTSVLVHNLDLSIAGPGGTFLPWTLDPANPNTPAVRTAANVRDNVEQVLIDAPAAGTYTITINGPAAISQNYSLIISGASPLTNESPTITLANLVSSIPETSLVPLNVADITIGDDVLGTNTLTITGADAALFEVVNNKLRIKSGVVLDFETNPVLDVALNVDDATLGGSPDDSELISILVLDRPDLLLTTIPFTNDTTPSLTVTVVDAGAGMPDGTSVILDIDRNNDGDFIDSGDTSSTVGMLTGGTLTIDISPALTTNSYKLRARASDTAAVEGTSGVVNLVVDLSPPSVGTFASSGERDTTPRLWVTASDSGAAGVAAGTPTYFDIDVNRDGDFTDPGELAYDTKPLLNGDFHDISPGFVDGIYSYRVRVADRAGNIGTTSTSTFKVDTTPPVVTLTTAAFTNDTSPSVTVTVVDALSNISSLVWIDVDKNNDGDFVDSGENGFELGVSNNGVATFDVTTLVAGTQRLRARASDNQSLEGFSSIVTVVVDLTPPVVTFAAPAFASDSTPPVTVTATDVGGIAEGAAAAVDVDLNGDGDFTDAGEANYASGSLSAGTATFDVSPPLVDGTYNLRTRVRDRATNEATSAVLTVVVDRASPSLFLLAPAMTNDATPTLSLGLVDPLAGIVNAAVVQVDVDLNNDGDFADAGEMNYATASNIAGTASFTLSPALAEGPARIRTRVSDRAGNEGTSNVVLITIDLTAPSITLVGPNFAVDTTPRYTVTASDANGLPEAMVQIDVDLNQDGDYADAGEGNYQTVALIAGSATFDLSPALSLGVFLVRAVVTDRAGNSQFAIHSVTISDSVPLVALSASPFTNDASPAVSVQVTGLFVPNGTAVEVDVDLNDDGDFDDSGEFAYATGTLTSGATVVVVSPNLAEGTYGLRARVTNSVEQEGVSSVFSLTVDVTSPTVLLTAPTFTRSSSPQLTVTATDSLAGIANGATVLIDVDRNNDGDFADLNELAWNTAPLTAGTATFEANVAVPQGTFRLRARVLDRAGNEGSSSASSVLADFSPPNVAVTIAGLTGDTTPLITVSASDSFSGIDENVAVKIDVDRNNDGDFDDAGELSYSLAAISNGIAITSIGPALPAGTFNVRARVQDRSGREGAAIATVVVDPINPSVILPAVQYVSSLVPIAVLVADANLAAVPEVYLDIDLNNDGAFNLAGELSAFVAPAVLGRATFPLTGLADGSYGVRARIIDLAGNVGMSITRGIMVDRAAPSVTLAGPSYTRDATPTLNVTARDTRSGVSDGSPVLVDVDLDGNGTFAGAELGLLTPTLLGGESIIQFPTPLPDGRYLIRARVQDAAQNTGAGTFTMVVDLVAPNLALSTAAITRGVPQLSVASSDANPLFGLHIKIDVDLNNDGDFADASESAYTTKEVGLPAISFPLSSALPRGLYGIRARLADLAGNEAISAISPVLVDTTGPVISQTVSALTSDNTPTVVVTAFDGLSGILDGTEVRIDIDQNNDFDFNDAGEQGYFRGDIIGGSATLEITPALPDGIMRIRAMTRDRAGNESFSTPSAVLIDSTPPVVQLQFLGLPGDTTPNAAITVVESGSGTPDGTPVQVDIDLNNDGDFSDADELAHITYALTRNEASIVVTPALALGDYALRVRVADAFGNEGVSSIHTFSIVRPPLTGVTLSNHTVLENSTLDADRLVGSLFASGPDPEAAYTFTLVAGSGDADNNVFVILGNQLFVRQGTPLDFETRPDYAVRIAATDDRGESLARAFVVQLLNGNDSPLLPNVDLSLEVIAEDSIPLSGTALGIVTAGTVDLDDPVRLGIAVLGTSVSSGGEWQYSLNFGQSWSPVGTRTPATALLVSREGGQIRFVPNSNFTGRVSFNYRAWDRSTGTSGSTVDLSQSTSVGGTTAYSANTRNAFQFVSPVNDAPVLDTTYSPTLPLRVEDMPGPSGLVRTFLSPPLVTDVDEGALRGLAVIGVSNPGQGTWQYTRDGGTTWVDFGAVTPATARLLQADGLTRVQFLPQPNYNGTVRMFYRAWDLKRGVIGETFDLSATTSVGGSTAFSAAVETIPLEVQARNDAPLLKTTVVPVLAPIDEAQTDSAGTLVKDLLVGAVLEADAGALHGIAVTFAGSGFGRWEYTRNSVDWQPLGSASPSAVRLLAADDLTKLRFVPTNPNFSGVVRINYRLWDQTQGIAGETRDLTGTGKLGGATAFSFNVETASITVRPVNDAPVLGGIGGSVGYLSGAADQVLAPLAIVSDIDNSHFAGGFLRVRISDGSSAANRLSVGGAFTVQNGSVLLNGTPVATLTGNGSGTTDLVITFLPSMTKQLAQQLLRAIVFSSTANTPGVRKVHFTLSDGSNGLSNELTKIVNVR